jgi:tRNA threonylcarbamoyladenosine biosynthesis protein TsaB
VKLLALDTSSNACSVAVSVNGDISERHVVEPKQHTQILLPMVDEVLQDAKLKLQDLDAIVLGNGPGSFIGMRIAASVAQGLAFGAGLKIVPVSSLAAVAAEVMTTENATAVAVAQDARMNEVYLGLYRVDATGHAALVEPEYLQPAGQVRWPEGSSWVAAGEGWSRYPELLELNRSRITSESVVRLPRARYLLALRSQFDAIEPHLLVPAYIRMKVAEPPKVRQSS